MPRNPTLVLAACAVALTLVACGGGGGGPPLPPPFTFTGVEPVVGTTAGGTRVTLRGSGFLEAEDDIAEVRFGANAVASFTVVHDGAIECSTPPGRVGIVNVSLVGKEDGRVLRSSGFRYAAALLWVADGGAPDLANLHYVDLDAGQFGLIGPLGWGLTGLAVSPDGTLFGVEDGHLHRVMQVDPGSGAATPIGLPDDVVTGERYDVRDITFVGNRLIGRTSTGRLIEMDQTYGFATVVQDLTPLVFGDGIAASGPDTVHLAPYEEGSALYAWDAVNLTTTAGPLVTTALEGTVDSMAYDDGMLYALDADPTGALPARLLRIDPVTGQAALVVELPPGARAVSPDGE